MLVVVSGPAGSGKTTLAHAIARAVPCPAVCRDEIKEGMVHAHGGGFTPAPGDELTRRTYGVFFDVLQVLLGAGVSVVGEAAFQDRLWRQGLEPLLPMTDLRIVHCHADPVVARERIERRLAEAPGRKAHADRQLLESLGTDGPQPFDAISIPAPSIRVDTTDGYRPLLDEILTVLGLCG